MEINITGGDALPTGALAGKQIICKGGEAVLTVTLTGTWPWSITYTHGTTPVTVDDILARSVHIPSISL